MQKALSIVQSGAVTGLLVVGLALLGTAGYYFYLESQNVEIPQNHKSTGGTVVAHH